MRTPARPPSVPKRTKRGRGFDVFGLETADNDEDEEFERVAARIPKRGGLAAMPEGKLELLRRGMRLRVANMRAVENKSGRAPRSLKKEVTYTTGNDY